MELTTRGDESLLREGIRGVDHAPHADAEFCVEMAESGSNHQTAWIK